MLYVVVSKRLHVSSTRCDHCRTCHQTILLACQLKIITVVLQPQHMLLLTSDDRSETGSYASESEYLDDIGGPSAHPEQRRSPSRGVHPLGNDNSDLDGSVRSVTETAKLFPLIVGRVPAFLAGVRRGTSTCVGWQATLCDPISQLASRSSEVCTRTAVA